MTGPPRIIGIAEGAPCIIMMIIKCNTFWMARADSLKFCQALSKAGHSVASSMGYFIRIMQIKAMRI